MLNAGIGGDGEDPNNDGETNFFEFASGQNPNASTHATPGVEKIGSTLEFTYTRSLAAMAYGMTYTVEWTDTLAAPFWSTIGVSAPNLIPGSDNGVTQQVKVTVPAGSNGQRFLHLKVSKP